MLIDNLRAQILSKRTYIDSISQLYIYLIRPACPYPLCTKVLDGIEHFKSHFAIMHGVNLIDPRHPSLASFPNTAARGIRRVAKSRSGVPP